MAYSNGRIYVDTSVTPNVGVSIADLQQCFAVVIEATIAGQTVRKLSGDLGVHCALKTGDTFTVDGVTWRVISRAEVSMWAKWRPIEPATARKVVPLTLADRQAVNFGIGNIPLWKATYLFRMCAYWFYDDNSSTNYPTNGEQQAYWTKVLPTTAFRLTDFVDIDSPANGYFHNAKAPITDITVSGMEGGPNGQIDVIYPRNEEGVTAGLTIKYEDLVMGDLARGAVSNMYFGIAFRKIGSTTYYAITQDTTMADIAEYGASVHMVFTTQIAQAFFGNTLSAQVEMFPFVSSVAIGVTYSGESLKSPVSNTGQISGNFIPLLEKQALTLGIRKLRINIDEFTAWKDGSVSKQYVYFRLLLASSEPDISVTAQLTLSVRDSSEREVKSFTLGPYTFTGGKEFTDEPLYMANVSGGWSSAYNIVLTVAETVANHKFKENTSDHAFIANSQPAPSPNS